jgi:plastocyanin
MKMKPWMLSGVVVVLVAVLAGCAGPKVSVSAPAGTGEKRIAMEASSFSFEPNEILAHSGDRLLLEVENTSGMDHNLTVLDPAGELLLSRHLPASSKVFAGIADLAVPRIHFGVGTGELLSLLGEAGADVVGVDWRVPLDEARRRVGPERALQGNLDPALCVSDAGIARAGARAVLARNAGHPGHIFNLGHGVLPETDPDVLAAVVELVHAEGQVTEP